MSSVIVAANDETAIGRGPVIDCTHKREHHTKVESSRPIPATERDYASCGVQVMTTSRPNKRAIKARSSPRNGRPIRRAFGIYMTPQSNPKVTADLTGSLDLHRVPAKAAS